MFREMRRKNQKLPEEAIQKILVEGSYGLLAVLGDEDYPYAVPLNYAWADNSIYVHCALEGHKIDALRRNPRASFTVVAEHEVVPKDLSTNYRSVVAFGTVEFLTDDADRIAALHLLGDKYAPNEKAFVDDEINRLLPITTILALRIEHVSGKESRALAKARREQQA